MGPNTTRWLVAAGFMAALVPAGTRAADKPAQNAPAASSDQGQSAPGPNVIFVGPAPGNGDQNGPGKGPGGPGGRGAGRRRGGPGNRPEGPGGFQRVFGEVAAVRGNVLQMRSNESEGLTRVILADDAQIIKDETLKTDALKPGAHVTGMGHQVDGTGTPTVPMKVDVQTLMVQGEGRGGGPFMFFGGGGPLWRGRRGEVFRKQNYSGSIEFDAQVKSVDPLVLADDQGNPLPIVLGDNVEVHQRAPRPIKEGDITAGARLVAMGEPTPDGLLNAHMVFVFGEGSDRGSLSGEIVSANGNGVTVRPRFAPQEMQITIDPAAKIYNQESLDLDSIKVGDTLSFTGKVVGGDAKAPTALVVRTITPSGAEAPQIDEGGGGGPFGGGRSVTATVTGKITAFDPLRVQTSDGREVTITVPGQIVYVRYRPADRSALKAGQKVLLAGRTRENGLVADTVVINPSLAMGMGFGG